MTESLETEIARANTLGRAWDEFDGYLFDIDGTLMNCTDAVHYFAFGKALSSVAGRPLTIDGIVAHGNVDLGILRDAFAASTRAAGSLPVFV